MNRLADAQSPYLLQHADNPVDWWPWSPEAFAEARRRDVPVLLSVGYAACHWCHVMARESFEDEATAGLVNAHFVAVKVDREERPDVDAVYMEAVQAATGQGGWPMTVFLTPDGEPFYFGTYFPPAPRHGMPSFGQVLEGVRAAWQDRRDEVGGVASRITQDLASRTIGIGEGEPGPPGAEEMGAALLGLTREFDAGTGEGAASRPRAGGGTGPQAGGGTSRPKAGGGFGGAPKFPPSMVLEFLLRHHARTGSEGALQMVEATCEAMARGGIYDQLGGGFARYSVDAEWVVPHFEKMLYDNALLCRVYAHLWRATGSEQARRVALETADFMVRELSTDEGGFASALDADSDDGEGGHAEGAYYVWTPAQLADVLGPEDAQLAATAFGVTEDGTFEGGASVLQLPDVGGPLTDAARLESVRRRLYEARAARPRPARDDKVVTAWNGLAVAALAETGAYFARDDLVDAARAAARLLAGLHTSDDGHRLVRTSRDGAPGTSAGVLEDYADASEGYLALYAVTGEEEWLERAGALLETVLERFAADDGTLFDTADDAERLIRRPQDPTDNAVPSGWNAAAGALLSYAAYTGDARHRDVAERSLGVVRALASRAPRFLGWGLAVGEALLDGPREVAVLGSAAEAAPLHRAALLSDAPGAVVAVGAPGSSSVPLLRDRGLVDGHAAAYVCHHFVCTAPVTDPDALTEALRA